MYCFKVLPTRILDSMNDVRGLFQFPSCLGLLCVGGTAACDPRLAAGCSLSAASSFSLFNAFSFSPLLARGLDSASLPLLVLPDAGWDQLPTFLITGANELLGLLRLATQRSGGNSGDSGSEG